eukprot:763937-Hanusia_phi.AAC.1
MLARWHSDCSSGTPRGPSPAARVRAEGEGGGNRLVLMREALPGGHVDVGSEREAGGCQRRELDAVGEVQHSQVALHRQLHHVASRAAGVRLDFDLGGIGGEGEEDAVRPCGRHVGGSERRLEREAKDVLVHLHKP